VSAPVLLRHRRAHLPFTFAADDPRSAALVLRVPAPQNGHTPADKATNYNGNAEVKGFFASGQHLEAARREAERREAERREAEVEAAVASQDVVALRQLMHASAHYDANESQRRAPTTALPAHLHRAAYVLLLRHALDSPDPPRDAVDRADAEGSAAAQIESALRGFTGDGYDLITRGVLRLHEITHLQAHRPARGGWQAAWSEAHTLLGQLCDSAGTSMGGSASSAAALSASLASEHGLTELLALLRAAEEDGELMTYDDLAAATAAAEQQSQTSRAQLQRCQQALAECSAADADAIGARNRARAAHVASLQAARQALMRASRCATASELTAACRRAEAAAETATTAVPTTAVLGLAGQDPTPSALKELLTPSVLRDALASFDAFVADARAARLIASACTAAAFVADPTNGLRNFDEHAACPRAQLVHVGFLVAAKLRMRVAALRGASVSCGQMAAEQSTEEEVGRRASVIVDEHRTRLQQARDAAEEAAYEYKVANLNFERAQRKHSSTADTGALKSAEEDLERARAALHVAKAALKTSRQQLYMDLRSFPELATLVPEGLPAELLSIEAPINTLQQYQGPDGTRPLDPLNDKISADGARHPVYRGMLNGSAVVLKEYPVTHASIRVCYKEVVLMRRLHHPGVLEVQQLFQEGDKLYLQMPYMEGGTLRSWCGAAERRPTARALCAVLYQLTSVVAHVHQQRCVHRDIKPENVLMDASGRPRLADFEISLDQTSAITETLTTRGTPGTRLYMAPELLHLPGAVATAASDMYALGVSFEQVAPNELNVTHLAQLIGSMKAEAPAARPTAVQALQHPYFAALFATERGVSCAICLDPFTVDTGAECDGGAHYVCHGCLATYVRTELDSVQENDARLEEHRARGGRIRCPLHGHGACAHSYADQALARELAPELFAEYRAAQDAGVKQRLWEDAQLEIQRRVREHQERQAREHQAMHDRSVLAEGLRRLMPNARQCGGCGRGPVDHYNCTDLQAHHGQPMGRGRISNACQQCGWFRARIAEWPPWDGRIWD
jgi:hypothetical protein